MDDTYRVRHHPGGCLKTTCWVDADAIEWHPGSAAGVYCVTPDGQCYLITGQDVVRKIPALEIRE